MKRINILTMILAAASLFTACKKDNEGSYSTKSTAYSVNYTSAINYNLGIQFPGQFSHFHWQQGTMNINELLFTAVHRNGNALTQEKFTTVVRKTVSLTTPSGALGTVKLPAVTSEMSSLGLALGGTGFDFALSLRGGYNIAVDMPPAPDIPVQIMINDPIELNTTWLNDLVINLTSYSATIEFSFDKLMEGITPNDMSQAVIANGTIIISSTSNPNLYKMITHNLQSNKMTIRFSAPQVLSNDPTF